MKDIPSSSSKLSILLPPNQMQIRAYEFAAIFETAFDQLNLIHNALSVKDFNRNNNQISSLSHSSDCSPFAFNLTGIVT